MRLETTNFGANKENVPAILSKTPSTRYEPSRLSSKGLPKLDADMSNRFP